MNISENSRRGGICEFGYERAWRMSEVGYVRVALEGETFIYIINRDIYLSKRSLMYLWARRREMIFTEDGIQAERNESEVRGSLTISHGEHINEKAWESIEDCRASKNLRQFDETLVGVYIAQVNREAYEIEWSRFASSMRSEREVFRRAHACSRCAQLLEWCYKLSQTIWCFSIWVGVMSMKHLFGTLSRSRSGKPNEHCIYMVRSYLPKSPRGEPGYDCHVSYKR